MRNGLAFVVYIDALGTSLNQHEYEGRFTEFQDEIIKCFRGSGWENWLVVKGFSDCVFFIFHLEGNKQNDEERLRDFFQKLVEFQRFCLDIDMPLRGGVSYGETAVDDLIDSIVTFMGGKPVIQAVRMEESLKMCGISFVPHFLLGEKYHQDYIQWINYLKEEKLILEFDTPTDYGLIELYCIRWPDDMDLAKICEEYSTFQPERAEDMIPPKKNVSAAAKYYVASKFICEGRKTDEQE